MRSSSWRSCRPTFKPRLYQAVEAVEGRLFDFHGRSSLALHRGDAAGREARLAFEHEYLNARNAVRDH